MKAMCNQCGIGYDSIEAIVVFNIDRTYWVCSWACVAELATKILEGRE